MIFRLESELRGWFNLEAPASKTNLEASASKPNKKKKPDFKSKPKVSCILNDKNYLISDHDVNEFNSISWSLNRYNW